MTEENNLALNIQARILPQIEGAQQFEQTLQEIPQKIQERMTQTVTSPKFTEGLSEREQAKLRHFAGSDVLAFQRLAEKQRELLEDLDADLAGGKLTSAQERKYLRKIGRQASEIRKTEAELLSSLDDPYFSFLGKDRRKILEESIKAGSREAIENLDRVKEKFSQIKDRIDEANSASLTFFEQMKRAGYFALGGAILNQAMKYPQLEAQIEARERTSFDLTSPIGMYQQRRMFDVFREVRERELNYRTLGGAIGGIAGGILSGGSPLGFLGGGYVGQQMGEWISGIMNIEEQSKAEEELKFLRQAYGTTSGMVNQARQYDILRARLIARAGAGAMGYLGLGYTPTQELGMRTGFADTLGRFDERMFSEQTVFARALGLNPAELYQFNISGRITGADYGIGGLHQARLMAKQIYGDDISSSRIVDVLKEIKTINEQLLRVNIEGDSKQALRIARIPELIFGKDSPYGRLGDLGGQTIGYLEGLMKPRNTAHEALLFRALGTNNLMEFTEMMKGGIYSGDSLNRILEYVKKNYGGTGLEYWVLNGMMPNTPKGFVPNLVHLINDPKRFTEFLKQNAEDLPQEERKRLFEQYKLTARKYTSETERMESNISRINQQAAEKWREMIYSASEEMARFWSKMGENSRMLDKLLGAQRKGFEFFDKWAKGHGYVPQEKFSFEVTNTPLRTSADINAKETFDNLNETLINLNNTLQNLKNERVNFGNGPQNRSME